MGNLFVFYNSPLLFHLSSESLFVQMHILML